MTEIKDQDPTEDNPQEDPKDSSKEEQSKETQKSHIETDDLPEKFKGKSASDIAKSYLELEKKLGSHSQTQTELDQWRALGNVIKQDPELIKALEKKVAGDKSQERPKDDTRDALSNKIVSDFEKEYSIDRLDPEKRQAMHKKIGEELADMLDPGGNKSTREILDSINLSKLPQYLGKAYRLATVDDESERARVKGILESQRNSEATFGSIPSTGGKSNNDSLTTDERETAKKLGISEEKYLKQKQEINK